MTDFNFNFDEEDDDMLFLRQWAIVGGLNDLRDKCHEAGKHEDCEKIDYILQAPRRKQRMMLRGLIAAVEEKATPVDFWGEPEGGERGILDIFTWFLENIPAILEMITAIIAIFSKSEAEGSDT